MDVINFILNLWVEVGDWVAGLLSSWGLPQWGVDLIADIVGVVILLVVGVAAVLIFTPMERKVIARMQDRPGPNRTPGYGAIQAVADAIKMLTKEDIVPHDADRFLHLLAPLLVAVPALLVYAVLPFGPRLIGQNLNVGILFIVAIGAVHVLAVLIAAWGSNNKYALLGGLRASAQALTYEVFMGLSLMGVVMLAGSFNLRTIVNSQQGLWYAVPQFIGMVVFYIAALAETHRLPLDLPEAETELISGYYTEYSGLKFGLFFLGEYLGMALMSALFVTLFLGGWHGPWLPPILWFLIKTVLVVASIVLMRATLPRPRYDQLMAYGWKLLLPLSLLNLLATGGIVLAMNT